MSNSPRRKWLGVGLGLLLGGAILYAQVIRSPASQFPSVSIETAGSSTVPSLGWVGFTPGFYLFSGTAVGVTGGLIPGTDASFDLGSATNRWGRLFLSGALSGTAFLAGDGSGGAPGFAFASQTTLGFYKIATTYVGDSGGLQLGIPGTAGAPALSWVSNAARGLFLTGTNIGVSGSLLPGVDATYTLGSASFRWTTLSLSGLATESAFLTGDGNSGAPAWAFSSQTGLGFYRIGSSVLGVTGAILPSTDNTFDLGTSGTPLTFRNGYFKGELRGGVDIIGWPAALANAVLLRNGYVSSSGAYGAGMVEITTGDQSALGDLHLNRIAAGPQGDATFTNGHTFWNFINTSVTALPNGGASSLIAFDLVISPTFTADMTQPAQAFYSEFSPNMAHNYTSTFGYSGVYAAFYPATGPGTLTEGNALIADAEVGSNGAVAALFSVQTQCCSFDPATGTAATITRSGYFHAIQPFSSSVPPVTHTALWIEDQTAGGTFTPSSSNYWLEVDAPSSHGTLGTATGLLGLWGATPTATSPLKVGATMSSTRFDDGNSGTTKTIDLSTGNVHKLTLTGNVTLTLTNPADSAEYYVELFTGAGSFTVTWPASVQWPAGTPPTITVTAARLDLIRLVYDSTSGEYWGTFNQNYTP